MKALFGGKCAICGEPFAKGDEINYDREAKKASHGFCYPGHVGEEEPEMMADRLGFKSHTWPELLKGMKPNG